MLSFSPSSTMPMRSTRFTATPMPGFRLAGSVKRLPIASPSRIATMMPLIAPEPSPSAAAIQSAR